MADFLLVARAAPSLSQNSDGGKIEPQGLRTGDLSIVEFIQRCVLGGRGFVANFGSVTTPLTFLVSAANRPDAWLRVPAATSIIPLMVNVALEAYAGTATEIDLRMAANDIGNGTSSAASVGPLSMSPGDDNGVATNVVARQLATGDTTTETTPISLYRRTYASVGAAGSEPGGAEIDRAKMGYAVLHGPATLELFIAATTTQATGFVVMQWVEVPSSWLLN